MYPAGGTAYFGFDAANRMTRALSPDAKATYWAYDASGLPLRKLQANEVVAYYSYDHAGRLLGLNHRKNGINQSPTFAYARLANGNISHTAIGTSGDMVRRPPCWPHGTGVPASPDRMSKRPPAYYGSSVESASWT